MKIIVSTPIALLAVVVNMRLKVHVFVHPTISTPISYHGWSEPEVDVSSMWGDLMRPWAVWASF